MKNKTSYYAIIPATVRYDKNLTPNAKLLYGEITALCNEKGYCWARNKYFADLYSVSSASISSWVRDLKAAGYINVEMNYKAGTKEILNRYIRISNNPPREILKDNNTINNTISSERNTAEEAAKEKRKKLKTLFFELYAAKAKEVTGTDLTADGKKIAPTWGAKENTLLKDDVENNGPASMDRYIKLFFSDKVSEVKDFCRGKNKAGYSYSVFHGMIEKLKLSKIPLPKACEHCGQIDGHSETCPIIIKKRMQEEEERRIILEEKEKAGELNLLKQVKQNVKQKVS